MKLEAKRVSASERSMRSDMCPVLLLICDGKHQRCSGSRNLVHVKHPVPWTQISSPPHVQQGLGPFLIRTAVAICFSGCAKDFGQHEMICVVATVGRRRRQNSIKEAVWSVP